MSKIAMLVVFLAVILAGSGLIFDTTVADDQTALSPTRTLGDKWTMSVNNQLPAGMKGTLTNQVTNTSALVSGHDCTEFTMTGGGTNSGGGIWTMNGKQYETKSDYSTVKSNNTIESSAATFNETMMTTTDYNPPRNSWSFPLFVGKNWTTNTTQTIVSQHTLNGDYSQGSENREVTFSFAVLRTEDIAVPAGEFHTFVVRMVLIDNTLNNGTSSDFYYSAKAHNTVKELDYLPNGNLVFSLELLNYSIVETTSTPTPTNLVSSTPTVKPTTDPSANPTTQNPSPSPTVPELSWLVIVPLLLSAFAVAVVVRHRKTADPKQ